MIKTEKIYDKLIHTDSEVLMEINKDVLRYIAQTSIEGNNSLEGILMLSFLYGYMQAKENVNDIN